MRQLCNLAYAVMVENLDEDGRAELDAKLAAEPGVTPVPRSRGTEDLMRMFNPGGMAAPRQVN